MLSRVISLEIPDVTGVMRECWVLSIAVCVDRLPWYHLKSEERRKERERKSRRKKEKERKKKIERRDTGENT